MATNGIQREYYLASLNSNNGEILQDKLQRTLSQFTSKNKGFDYRFYDTKTARSGFVPAQPGDFMLLIPNNAVLIECKSTKVGTKLLTMAHKGNVGKLQIAKHRMWHRAGHPSLYLHLDLKTDAIEWHSGKNVVNKIYAPLFTGNSKQVDSSLKTILENLNA